MQLLAEGKPLTLDCMTADQQRLAADFVPLPWVQRRFRITRARLARIETYVAPSDRETCFRVVIKDLTTGRELPLLGGHVDGSVARS